MIIQLLLVVGIGAAGVFAYRGAPGARSLAVRRAAFSAMLAAAAVAVVAPDLVTRVANAVGVGRGTDLVLYFFVLASVFVWIGLYRRLHDMEQRFVHLTRTIALDRADRSLVVTDGQRPLEGPPVR